MMHTILNGICKLQEHKQRGQSLLWQFMEASYPTMKEHLKPPSRNTVKGYSHDNNQGPHQRSFQHQRISETYVLFHNMNLYKPYEYSGWEVSETLWSLMIIQ